MDERPHDAHVDAISRETGRQQLSRELCHAIGIFRHEFVVFNQRMVGGTIDHRGAWHQDGCAPRLGGDRLEQKLCAPNVAGKRRRGSIPRVSHVRGARAVVHDRGCGVAEGVADGRPVEQVDGHPVDAGLRSGRPAAGAVPRDDARLARGETVEEVAAGKSGAAGHQNQ